MSVGAVGGSYSEGAVAVRGSCSCSEGQFQCGAALVGGSYSEGQFQCGAALVGGSFRMVEVIIGVCAFVCSQKTAEHNVSMVILLLSDSTVSAVLKLQYPKICDNLYLYQN